MKFSPSFSLPSLGSLASLDGVSLHRMLRRESLQPVVQITRRVLAAISFLLLVFIIHQLIQTYLSVETRTLELRQSVETARSRAAEPQRVESPPENLHYVVDRSVFGEIAVPTPPPSADASKPVNKAPLALIGSYITDGDASSFAIIEDQKKKIQEVFGIGETIFGEARLIAIFRDKVEIERNNAREFLALDEKSGSSGSDFKGGIAAVDDTNYIVEEAELDKALENLPVLLTQARAVPYFRDGKSMGLRLFAVKTGSMYEKLGLKNGDILKGINGNSLADLSQAMQLFEKLKTERSISVTLERNNAEKEMKYEIR